MRKVVAARPASRRASSLTNAGPNATTFTLAPELFPTQLRGTAGGFASAAAKLGATLGVLTLPPLRSALGIGGVVAATIIVTLLGLSLTALLAHEVREGGPLEERHRPARDSARRAGRGV